MNYYSNKLRKEKKRKTLTKSFTLLTKISLCDVNFILANFRPQRFNIHLFIGVIGSFIYCCHRIIYLLVSSDHLFIGVIGSFQVYVFFKICDENKIIWNKKLLPGYLFISRVVMTRSCLSWCPVLLLALPRTCAPQDLRKAIRFSIASLDLLLFVTFCVYFVLFLKTEIYEVSGDYLPFRQLLTRFNHFTINCPQILNVILKTND